MNEWRELEQEKSYRYPTRNALYEHRHRVGSYWEVLDVAFDRKQRFWWIIAKSVDSADTEKFLLESFWNYFKNHPLRGGGV